MEIYGSVSEAGELGLSVILRLAWLFLMNIQWILKLIKLGLAVVSTCSYFVKNKFSTASPYSMKFFSHKKLHQSEDHTKRDKYLIG